MADSNQVRINELARELEIKAKVLIEYLPEAGVTEKKTHSSSIDLVHAERVRKHFRDLAAAEEAAEAEKSAKTTAAKKPAPKPAAAPAAAPVTAAAPIAAKPAAPVSATAPASAARTGVAPTAGATPCGPKAATTAPTCPAATSRTRSYRRNACSGCRIALWYGASACSPCPHRLIRYHSDFSAYRPAQYIHAAPGSALASIGTRRSAPGWFGPVYAKVPARDAAPFWPRSAPWRAAKHASCGCPAILSSGRSAARSPRWSPWPRRSAWRSSVALSAAAWRWWPRRPRQQSSRRRSTPRRWRAESRTGQTAVRAQTCGAWRSSTYRKALRRGRTQTASGASTFRCRSGWSRYCRSTGRGGKA